MGTDLEAPHGTLRGVTHAADVLAALRSQVHQVHGLLHDQVSAAIERTRTAPVARSEVLSRYVHALCIEDTTVNVLLRQHPPLFTDVWSGGLLSPRDLTTLQGYAQVVHASTDALLRRLTPTALWSSIDLSDAGFGYPNVSWVLNRFVLWETAMICGEIAARSVVARPAVNRHNGRSNGHVPASSTEDPAA